MKDDRQLMSLLFAVCEVFIKENPKLNQKLVDALNYYRDVHFVPGANAMEASEAAIRAINMRVKDETPSP